MSSAVEEAVRRLACPAEGTAEARRIAGALADAAEGLQAAIFFGSRKSGAGPNEASAYDLFLAVDDYGAFYRSLARVGWVARPRMSTLLNRVLPPNIVSLSVPVADQALLAKCAVIETSRLERETSARRHDHFCAGRLCQPVEIVWALDDAARRRAEELLLAAVRETAVWSRPWLREGRFDVERYYRTLLEVSLAGEIRPEPSSRAARLFVAQCDAALPVYMTLLHELEMDGRIVAAGDGAWRWARPVGRWERVRARAYFTASKTRATLRWGKYMVTFEGWLDYLLRKVTRHTGQEIILSPRERRYPLIFLWPRFFRYLRDKDGRAQAADRRKES